MEHLPLKTLETVIMRFQSEGVTSARTYLKSLGYAYTSAEIKAFCTKASTGAIQAGEGPITTLSEQPDVSALIKATALAQAQCCDRLQAMALATQSYRVEIALSESLSRLHSQLMDIDF
jgi:hypothetical protein